ncbi:hypothetical protein SAMN05216196_101480 [Lutimaribacter pacificus]|uniref:Uncharacterized protein n=1 Tax=Lutimaribacter pacificus TaxID=391948 RepID=A0A1H0B8H9_9RHOB|nr:hypothetical protein [Lutimaribacter pacificus]SDN41957.1 hypothetical protein SAMN05216196_101480 [Lutimaribacter pacificus]SHJ59133.1 hypothetical protein SAMN05444142_101737 [Lutimaribacter pacificus]
MRHVVLALALAAATPAASADFVALNGHRVNALQGAATFEVIGRPGSGPQQYFCAAADYARQVLNAPANKRLSILRGRGPSQTQPGRRAVAFILDDGAGRRPGQGMNFGLSVTEPGFNVSVGMARNSFCYDDDPLWLY